MQYGVRRSCRAIDKQHSLEFLSSTLTGSVLEIVGLL